MHQIRKLSRPAQGSLDKPDLIEPELQRRFPTLHQHMTQTRYEDGSARQVCSVTIFAQRGVLRGFLNDRDSGGSLGVEASTLQGLLGALEAELTSDAPAWFWRQGGADHPAKNRGKKA